MIRTRIRKIGVGAATRIGVVITMTIVAGASETVATIGYTVGVTTMVVTAIRAITMAGMAMVVTTTASTTTEVTATTATTTTSLTEAISRV